jgi:hypothetical protein
MVESLPRTLNPNGEENWESCGNATKNMIGSGLFS